MATCLDSYLPSHPFSSIFHLLLLKYDFLNVGQCIDRSESLFYFAPKVKLARPFQLQEYQTDMWKCRFDTPGKLIPAHCAGAPTARELWVAPGRWVGAELTAAGPPTTQVPI